MTVALVGQFLMVVVFLKVVSLFHDGDLCDGCI